MVNLIDRIAALKKALGEVAGEFLDLFEILYTQADANEVKEEVKGIHKSIIKMYEEFCLATLHRKARLRKEDHLCIKQIAGFLVKGESEKYAIKMMYRIFQVWEDLPDFYRSQTEMTQIWKSLPHLLTHANAYYVGVPDAIMKFWKEYSLAGESTIKKHRDARADLARQGAKVMPKELSTMSELKSQDRRDLYGDLTWMLRAFEKKTKQKIQTIDQYRALNDSLVGTYPRLLKVEVMYALQLAIKGMSKGWRTPNGYNLDKIINSYLEHRKLIT